MHLDRGIPFNLRPRGVARNIAQSPGSFGNCVICACRGVVLNSDSYPRHTNRQKAGTPTREARERVARKVRTAARARAIRGENLTILRRSGANGPAIEDFAGPIARAPLAADGSSTRRAQVDRSATMHGKETCVTMPQERHAVIEALRRLIRVEYTAQGDAEDVDEVLSAVQNNPQRYFKRQNSKGRLAREIIQFQRTGTSLSSAETLEAEALCSASDFGATSPHESFTPSRLENKRRKDGAARRSDRSLESSRTRENELDTIVEYFERIEQFSRTALPQMGPLQKFAATSKDPSRESAILIFMAKECIREESAALTRQEIVIGVAKMYPRLVLIAPNTFDPHKPGGFGLELKRLTSDGHLQRSKRERHYRYWLASR